jgi:hypothetical protein
MSVCECIMYRPSAAHARRFKYALMANIRPSLHAMQITMRSFFDLGHATVEVKPLMISKVCISWCFFLSSFFTRRLQVQIRTNAHFAQINTVFQMGVVASALLLCAYPDAIPHNYIEWLWFAFSQVSCRSTHRTYSRFTSLESALIVQKRHLHVFTHFQVHDCGHHGGIGAQLHSDALCSENNNQGKEDLTCCLTANFITMIIFNLHGHIISTHVIVRDSEVLHVWH